MYFASAKSGGSLRNLLAICDFFRLLDKSAWAFGTARER